MTTPKLCKDCKHFLFQEWKDSLFQRYECVRPNLVDGSRGNLNGTGRLCLDERHCDEGRFCGPEAKYWEEKE